MDHVKKKERDFMGKKMRNHVTGFHQFNDNVCQVK